MIDLGDDFFWPSTSSLFPAVTCSVSASLHEPQENWIFWEMSSRCLRVQLFAWYAHQVQCGTWLVERRFSDMLKVIIRHLGLSYASLLRSSGGTVAKTSIHHVRRVSPQGRLP